MNSIELSIEKYRKYNATEIYKKTRNIEKNSRKTQPPVLNSILENTEQSLSRYKADRNPLSWKQTLIRKCYHKKIIFAQLRFKTLQQKLPKFCKNKSIIFAFELDKTNTEVEQSFSSFAIQRKQNFWS